ncbi:S1 family peptidase [Streptomycetaceae bacterium NBC_01309]
MQRQHVLTNLAKQIADVPEDERYRIPGYAGMILDPDSGTLNVYWKGVPPKSVDSVVRTVPPGFSAKVHQAPYSAAELEDARKRVLAATNNGQAPLQADNVISAVSLASDGSGLELGYTSPTLTEQSVQSAETRTGFTAPDSSAVKSRTEEIAGVAVKVKVQNRTEPVYSRQDDTSPFWGGAALLTPLGTFCSTGFGARIANTGANVMITAEHCGASGSYSTINNTYMGDVVAASAARDTTVIGLPLAYQSGAGYYDGPWDTSIGKNIVSSNYNWTGEYVCTSGAMSGVHCNNKIYNDNTVVVDDLGVTRGPAILAKRTNLSDMASAKGDSGGPVVTSPDGTYGVNMEARGIIHGGLGGQVACPGSGTPGTGTAGPTNCYESVAYIAIRRILADFNLELQGV